MNLKSGIAVFVISIFVNLYTTFVLMCLWNWFAVDALNVPHISYWIMYGLVMMIKLVSYKSDTVDDQRWKWLETVILSCIPEEKRADLAEEIKVQKHSIVMELGLKIFETAFGSTVTLGVGWAVHVFLA